MSTENHTGDQPLEPKLKAALDAYNAPPVPPLEDMWKQIERAQFGATVHTLPVRRSLTPLWLATAAALVLGVAIGHFGLWSGDGAALRTQTQHSSQTDETKDGGKTMVAKVDTPAPNTREHSLVSPVSSHGGMAMPAETPYELTANRYLGRTAALLAVLPGAAAIDKRGVGAQVNAHFAEQATELLSTTRLLLDSPAVEDPALQKLLPDLELVLAQVASLSSVRTPEELKLITDAVKQHDVLPRLQQAVLRTAKAGMLADEDSGLRSRKDSIADSL